MLEERHRRRLRWESLAALADRWYRTVDLSRVALVHRPPREHLEELVAWVVLYWVAWLIRLELTPQDHYRWDAELHLAPSRACRSGALLRWDLELALEAQGQKQLRVL